MNLSNRIISIGLVMVALFAGCSDSEVPPGSDSGVSDAGVDSGDDSSVVDLGAADLGESDSGSEDLGIVDLDASVDASLDADVVPDAGDDAAGDAAADVDAGPATCGGFGGIACAEGSFCDFAIDDICGFADASGTCAPIPESCDDVDSPVCGCNGEDYINRCRAAMAGTSVLHAGVCTGGV